MAKRYRYLLGEFKRIAQRIDDRPINFMEIGTWKGVRAVEVLSSTTKRVNYFGFDLFEDLTDEVKTAEFCGKAKPPAMHLVGDMIKKKTGKSVKLFRGYSQKTVPQAVPILPKMDLIFIDGGHSVDTIRTDWENIQPLIGPETVVVFDDYYLERNDFGCREIVMMLAGEPHWDAGVWPQASDHDRKSGLTICLAKVRRKNFDYEEAGPG